MPARKKTLTAATKKPPRNRRITAEQLPGNLPVIAEQPPADVGKNGPKNAAIRELLADQCYEFHCRRYPHSHIAKTLGIDRQTVSNYVHERMLETEHARKEKNLHDLETLLAQQDNSIAEAWTQIQMTEKSLQQDEESRVEINKLRAAKNAENEAKRQNGDPAPDDKAMIPEMSPDRLIAWAKAKSDLIKGMNQSNELWGKALGIIVTGARPVVNEDATSAEERIRIVQEMMTTPISFEVPGPPEVPPEFLETEGDGIPERASDFRSLAPPEPTTDESSDAKAKKLLKQLIKQVEAETRGERPGGGRD